MYYLFVLLFPLLGTTIGAILGTFFKFKLNKVNAIIAGVSAGVMLAASIFSLLIPSLDKSNYLNKLSFIPPTIGFILGILFLLLSNILIDKYLSKKSLMNFSIILHNIPEGMVVGVMLIYSLNCNSSEGYLAAISLAFGIGIQNIPEGAIISMKSVSDNSRFKSFIKGFISGIYEPVASLLSCLFYCVANVILPYALSFSASCMIYVILDELCNEGRGNKYYFMIFFMIGFIIMMILDVVLS